MAKIPASKKVIIVALAIIGTPFLAFGA
jgi:hypothetical protein